LAKLDKIDFDALVKSMTDVANSANQLLSSPDLKATVTSLKNTAENLNKTVVTFRRELGTFSAKTDPLIASLKKTSDDADVVLAQTKATMVDVQSAIAPDSALRYRVDTALDNLSEASSAIRQLADYLQRNPSAVVRGKYVPDNR
jgi:paraquat-inducible protein B